MVFILLSSREWNQPQTIQASSTSSHLQKYYHLLIAQLPQTFNNRQHGFNSSFFSRVEPFTDHAAFFNQFTPVPLKYYHLLIAQLPQTFNNRQHNLYSQEWNHPQTIQASSTRSHLYNQTLFCSQFLGAELLYLRLCLSVFLSTPIFFLHRY